MDVKKIFTILITIVACVVIGAFILNLVMPNAITGVASSVENMIFKASGISLDLNGDGNGGKNSVSVSAVVNANNKSTTGGVIGWG